MNQDEVMQRLHAGMQVLQAGNLDAAEQVFRTILALDALEIHSLHFLGVVLCQKGDMANGVSLIEKSISIDPSRLAPYCNLGRFLVADKQSARAVSVLQEAVKREEKSFEAWDLLAKARFQQGDLEGALESGQHACAINPEDPEGFFNLGALFNALDEPAKAVAAYEQATLLKSDYLEAWFNLGNTLKEQGEFDGAIGCYRKAIGLKSDFADAYLALGVALNEVGEIEEASAAYAEHYRQKPIAKVISLPAIASQREMSLSDEKQVKVPELAEFVPSYLSKEIPFGMHLMYVHIPKTGGVRFGNPISDCIQRLFFEEGSERFHELLVGIFPSNQFSLMSSHRIGSKPMRDGIARAFDSYGLGCFDFSYLMPHGVSSDELVAMQNNFGVSPTRLATWREPEKRLKSALNYLWRISGGDLAIIREKIYSRDSFLDNAIYRACFSDFHGALEIHPESELKVDYLIDIGDFSLMNQVMSNYLSRCRLPNIVVNKGVNVTSDDKKMDSSLLLHLTEECIDAGFITHDSSPVIQDLVQKKLPAEYVLDFDESAVWLNPLTFVVNARTNVDTSAKTYFLPTNYLTSEKGQAFLEETFS